MSRFVLLFGFCVLPGITERDSAGTDRSLSPTPEPLEINRVGPAPHSLPAPSAEPGWNFRSPLARDAKKEYDAALTAAETSYSLAKSNAGRALTTDLQAAARSQRRPCLPVGRWRVEFANGVAETCEIRTDGTAVVIEPQRTAEGKITSRDGSFLIACNDDRIERWTPVGRRIVVEHWFPIAKFPVAMAVLGIAERLPAEQKELEMAKKLFHGIWSAVALEENGQETPKEELNKQNLVLTFEGNTFRLEVGTGVYQGTFRIDPSANPKTIDFIWKRFGGGHILPEETFIAQGIYQMEGETLKIRHGLRASAAVPEGISGVFLVWGTTRPKDFMTSGAWQTTTYICRKKPTVPVPPLPPAPPRRPD